MKEKRLRGCGGGPGISYGGEFLSSAHKALSSNPSITTKSKQTGSTAMVLLPGVPPQQLCITVYARCWSMTAGHHTPGFPVPQEKGSEGLHCTFQASLGCMLIKTLPQGQQNSVRRHSNEQRDTESYPHGPHITGGQTAFHMVTGAVGRVQQEGEERKEGKGEKELQGHYSQQCSKTPPC